ncbi:ABC transporter permease [Chryseolinea soli]|nr:ABC transporter permease [Chryseolinea soli]
MMLRHTLLLLFRNIQRFRTTFLINLIGLSTGLASALLIYLWVHDEKQVDAFHEKRDRLYQVMTNTPMPDGLITSGTTGGGLHEALVKEMPEVEHATVITPAPWFQKFTVSSANHDVTAHGQFVGRDFFNVFSYPLIQGSKDNVLADKQAIVISATLAKKLFNSIENSLGKTVDWKWLNLKRSCTVTGVFADVTAQSTQQFDFAVSFETWKDIVPVSADVRGGPFLTYVVLKEGASPGDFQNKLAAFLKQKDPASTATLFAARYADTYLYGDYSNGVATGGRIAYVKLFSLIAMLIVVIACINFMNLSTARASRRLKEVGIKKVVGAGRRTLVVQYLLESVFVAILSLIVAVALVQLLLPVFNTIMGKQLTIPFEPNVVLTIAAITLLTGLLAGSYPAFYLSGFQPARVLKGHLGKSLGELWTRKGLVAVQFALSVFFIVAVMVIYRQVEFIQTAHLGFDQERLLYFQMEGAIAEHPDAFLTELKNVPGVAQASSMQQTILMESFFPTPGLRWEGKNEDDKIGFAQLPVNYDLLETLGITLAEGRSFSRSFPADTAAIILNQTAIDLMELKNPVGKTVTLWGAPVQIIGVAKDFHFQSYREKVKPFIFRLAPKETMLVMVRLEAGNASETVSRIHALHKTFNPGFTWEYAFLNDAVQAQYASEKQVASLSRYFAGLAVLISCLGLFALAAFTAERRRSEIGIRKVLGATETAIVYLLSAEFTKIVIVAIAIALPISYLLLQQWLDHFAYRISLDAVYFIFGGGLALGLAWFTVGLQTFKAARMNPVKNLRSE